MVKNEKEFMATGRQSQLIKQVGEYLVAAELCRRGLIAASFSGNIPIFDILAINVHQKMRTIQVKTTATKKGWNIAAKTFLNISQKENVQKIEGLKNLQELANIFCFVILKSFGSNDFCLERDEFYLIPVSNLQEIIYREYKTNLDKKGGIRSKNPDSDHMKIQPSHISEFKEKWDYLFY
jgi:hypothetical protein